MNMCSLLFLNPCGTPESSIDIYISVKIRLDTVGDSKRLPLWTLDGRKRIRLTEND